MAWTERYVRDDAAGGGDGTTDANSGANGAWTLAEGITNAAAGYRINVRAGTYANTTTTRTFNASGSATAPIWWRGFQSTAGDLDSRPTSLRTPGTTMPSITFTTGQFAISGACQYFSNLAISGACTSTGGQVRVLTNDLVEFWRCRMENTAANSASRAMVASVGNVSVYECYFKSTSSASCVAADGGQAAYVGSVFDGGLFGLSLGSTNSSYFVKGCVFSSPASDAIACVSANIFICDNTIYNPGGHGISLPSGFARVCSICNNLFHTVTGSGKNGINYGGASTVKRIFRMANSYYNVTTPEAGFGDEPDPYRVTEGSDPLVDPANGDFRLKTTASSFQVASPGLFEGLSVQSYASIGAQIPDETGGSSGGFIIGG